MFLTAKGLYVFVYSVLGGFSAFERLKIVFPLNRKTQQIGFAVNVYFFDDIRSNIGKVH